jgi:hypothetical protein
VPDGQREQAEAAATAEYFPASHTVQAELSPVAELYLPTGQLKQEEMLVPNVVRYVPIGQLVHVDAPAKEYFPIAQFVHEFTLL